MAQTANARTYFKIDRVAFVMVTSCYLVAEEASDYHRVAETSQRHRMLELRRVLELLSPKTSGYLWGDSDPGSHNY